MINFCYKKTNTPPTPCLLIFCLWNSFLEFAEFFDCSVSLYLFDDLLYLKSDIYFPSCHRPKIIVSLLHLLHLRAKRHPTKPVLLMPKREVIIYTSRHHILSPLELNFSMNHPIYQVNCILFTFSISCLTFFTICKQKIYICLF